MSTSKKKIKIRCEGAATIPLEDLHWFQGELKDLPEKEEQELRASLLNNGFIEPFKVWRTGKKNNILDGHQRKYLLTKMADEDITLESDPPVVFVKPRTFSEARKFVLLMTSQYGKITKRGLQIFVDDSKLKIEDLRLEVNIPNVKIETLLFPKAPEEEEISAPDKPVTQPGDLYELPGGHRLVCADARQKAPFEDLMGGTSAGMIVTDPPYNVDYVGKTKDKLKIENDSMSDAEFKDFLLQMFVNAFGFLNSGRACYMFHADTVGHIFRTAYMEAGFLLKQCLVWVKNSMVMGRQDYHWQHEPILYGWKPGQSHLWNSDRTQTTVLRYNRPTSSAFHPTMKPVDLISKLILNSSAPGDSVLDFCSGSGSALIACHETDRVFRGIEIDPVYVDASISRWCRHTKNTRVTRNGEAVEWAI